MADDDRHPIPALPRPLRWSGRPESWSVEGPDALSIRAGGHTDWFVDPGTGTTVISAPALLMPAPGSWMLRARVSAEHRATFDAAVLVVRASDRAWAKLCLERSPQGEVMVVSVVTRGSSDDCNGVVVGEDPVHLRVSRLGRAYAFHHSRDGARWDLVRYFALDEEGEPEVGFLAQSPTGEGCTARFEGIAFVSGAPGDIRSGE